MSDDAGPQAFGFEEQDHKEKADGAGIADLAEIGKQRCAAAVEKIDDVADAEGEGGYDHCGFEVVFTHGIEKEAAEDQFFQKTHADHTAHGQSRFQRRKMEVHAEPQIDGNDEQQWDIEEEIFCF